MDFGNVRNSQISHILAESLRAHLRDEAPDSHVEQVNELAFENFTIFPNRVVNKNVNSPQA